MLTSVFIGGLTNLVSHMGMSWQHTVLDGSSSVPGNAPFTQLGVNIGAALHVPMCLRGSPGEPSPTAAPHATFSGDCDTNNTKAMDPHQHAPTSDGCVCVMMRTVLELGGARHACRCVNTSWPAS
jgi:hypothetical protein